MSFEEIDASLSAESMCLKQGYQITSYLIEGGEIKAFPRYRYFYRDFHNLDKDRSRSMSS